MGPARMETAFVVARWVLAVGIAGFVASVALGEGLAQGFLGLGSAALVVCVWAQPDLRAEAWQALRSPPLAFLGAWVLIGLVALPIAASGTPAHNEISKLSAVLAVPLLGIGLGRLTPRQRRAVLWAALGGVALTSAFGLLQLVVDVTPWFDWIIPIKGHKHLHPETGGSAVSGLLFHRLKLAHVLMLALPFALFAASDGRVARRWRVAAAAVACLGGLALFFSYARTAQLALPTALAVVLLLRRPLRQTIAIGLVGCALLAALVVASPSVRARFTPAEIGESLRVRSKHLELGLRLIREHPVTGTGYGTFAIEATHLRRPGDRWLQPTVKAHNQYLSVWAETGIVGLAAWLAFWCSVLIAAWRSPPPWGGACATGVVALLLVCLVHDPLFHVPVALAAFATAGVSLHLSRSS